VPWLIRLYSTTTTLRLEKPYIFNGVESMWTSDFVPDLVPAALPAPAVPAALPGIPPPAAAAPPGLAFAGSALVAVAEPVQSNRAGGLRSNSAISLELSLVRS
jgi:hypothetical protein